MAYLEFTKSGKCFQLMSNVNVIGNEVVPRFNTLILMDNSIQSKHAVIVEEHGFYQIMDICSGSTSLKLSNATPFELLEPMKFYKLSHLDLIQFGDTDIAKFNFRPEKIDDSSQATQSYDTSVTLKNSSQKKHFFVSETEETSNMNDYSPLTLFEIPETQDEMQEPIKHNTSGNSITDVGTEETVLDLISEYDKKSNDAIMYSQNIFANHSLCKKSSSPQLDVDVLDDGLEEFEKSLVSKKNDATYVPDISSDIEAIRDGSVTPDFLESNGDMICPQPVPQQIKTEPVIQPGFKQSEIETQLNYEIIKEEIDSQKVRQTDIETQILDYNCSSEDEDDKESKKQPNFLAEQTQPIASYGFRTRNQIRKQAEIKPKTVSLTDFDQTQRFVPSPQKSNLFAVETQPVMLYIPANILDIDKSKNNKRKTINRILLSSDESEEEHQSASFKADVKNNKKQAESDKINLKPHLKPSEGYCSIASPTTPARYSNSPLMSDTATPKKIPKLPNDSQIGMILDLINESQPSNDSVGVFDTMIEEDGNEESIKQHRVQDTEKKAKKRVRRRIMKYDSDSDDDEPGSPKKKMVKITLQKKQTPTVSAKTYAIAISNIKGSQKEKYIAMSEKLGCTIVNKVSQADILLSSKTVKFTSKFLAAICKGIPIVSADFIDDSTKNLRWMAPENYIIFDDATEKEKGFSLQNILRKVKTTKMFADHSVFVTSHTTIPFEEIKELVEIAGGECLEVNATDVPKRKKLVLIYNSMDKNECKAIVEKYPNLIRLKDICLVKAVLRQSLSNA